MAVQLDFNAALDAIVGPDHGISMSDLDALTPRVAAVHADLMARRDKGELGFFDLPLAVEEAKRIQDYANNFAKPLEAIVHLGIGGSGLGPTCIQQALNHPYYNEDARFRNGRPRLYVVDNSDPEMLAGVMDVVDPKAMLLHVVSKSGTTPETMTAFMTCWDMMVAQLGVEEAAARTVFTTDPKDGLLRAFANRHKIATFPVPPNVGGRFSVLTSVGLLPAALTGVEAQELLDGAAEMSKRCLKPNLLQNPAYLCAALHYLADTKKGKKVAVMMPYAQSLKTFAAWWVQLWAESLGKRVDRAGKEVWVGQTAVGALGATDQHSQVQLFVEGPNDKILTFIEVERYRRTCGIPAAQPGLEELTHFADKDMGELIQAEKRATEFALSAAQRPSITWKLDAVDARHLGALFYVYEVATAFAGGLYGIDAFDQPGVEEGKRATHALLGRGTAKDAAKLRDVEAMRARYKQPLV